jgi:hypothetical protein
MLKSFVVFANTLLYWVGVELAPREREVPGQHDLEESHAVSIAINDFNDERVAHLEQEAVDAWEEAIGAQELLWDAEIDLYDASETITRRSLTVVGLSVIVVLLAALVASLLIS